MKTGRLYRLASFLDKLDPERFEFDLIRKETKCGSVGCAMGLTPIVFPKLVRKDGNSWVASIKTGNWIIESIAEEIFEISVIDATLLFYPNYKLPWLNNKKLSGWAEPQEVAKSIRAYIRWRKKNPIKLKKELSI